MHFWKKMNYDSFHIWQTAVEQRALSTQSISTDTITNWHASHTPPPPSKGQIRYLRSLKADASGCRSFLVYQQHVFLRTLAFGLNDSKKARRLACPDLKWCTLHGMPKSRSFNISTFAKEGKKKKSWQGLQSDNVDIFSSNEYQKVNWWAWVYPDDCNKVLIRK